MINNTEAYKLLIIGGGAAGYTAAIYAARAGLSPVLVQGPQPGGQLTITTEVENYPGFSTPIMGPKLMEEMLLQAKNVGANVVSATIKSVDFADRPFACWNSVGTAYQAHAVIIATGADAKWLGLESEKFFLGHGVSSCATCDGFFFRDQVVAVVGGGNTAVEEALFLSSLAKQVILIHRRDTFRAERILQERLFAKKNVEILWNKTVTQVLGEHTPKCVKAIELCDTKTQSTAQLAVDALFVAIGHKPNTEIFAGQIEIDSDGYIKTLPGTTKTNIPGVFSAGDVSDKVYRQAVTAAGTGCMAALDADRYLANLSL